MQEVCIVKLGTEAYKRGGVYFHGRTIRVLRKQTTYDLLADEVDNIGLYDAIESIINLNDVEDGVYQLMHANIGTDWETGWVESWDLKLVPYEKA